jgi:PEP-CTERM motif
VRKSLVVLSLLAPLLATAATVSNGDFESGAAGWTVAPVVYIGPVAPYDGPLYSGVYTGGLQAAFFGAGDSVGGSIYQDITTVAGQKYQVSFTYGAVAYAEPQSLLASAIDGVSLGSTAVSASGTFDRAAILSPYSFMFTAASGLTRLTFADTSSVTTSVDGVLDNVSITAVPEAGTISMMLGGLAMMGFMARRRRF